MRLRLFVVGCFLAGLCSQGSAQTVISFGQTVSGTISAAAQTNSYTFSSNAGDVIDFTLVATSGSLVPNIRLYNPVGTLIASNYSGSPFGCSGSSLEMNTTTTSTTGTYTVTVSDCNSTNTGSYRIYSQRTNNPSGATALPFGQTEAGAVGGVAASTTYTFSANANDVVDFTLITTSGGIVPKVRLYNPSGTLNSSNYSGSPFGCSGSSVEMNTVTLPVTGTYTVLIGDCSDTNTGNYEIDTQKTDAPSGYPNLPFGQSATGSISSATQSNTYTFSANANDVVDFTLVTTSSSLIPKIRLYDPSGALNSSNYSGSPFGCSGSSLEMNAVTLPVTGTYTVLIGDCNDTNTGNYSIYTQRTNNPSGASTLPFALVQSGLVGSVASSMTYTFSANANDVIDFTLLTTNGSLIPKISLYNPSGALNSSNYSGSPFGCSGSSLEMNTVTLPATGAYTVLIGDCGDTNTGNYNVYAQRTNNPTGASPFLFGGQAQTGTVGSTAQSVTYTFGGASNSVVDFTMTTTSGSLIPKIRLYSPAGALVASNSSGAPFGCSGSTVQLNSVSLTQSGSYTMLVGDCGDANTGNYVISGQCFGTCPIIPTITWAAPAPINYGTALSGTQLDATAKSSGSTVAGTFVYTPPSGTVLTAGTQTLSTLFTPTDETTYSLASASVSLTVNRATPTCTWATPPPITYGTALSSTQLNASCSWIVGGVSTSVPGKFVYSPASGTVIGAGSNTLSATFTPTDTVDYEATTVTVQVTVNPVTPTVNWATPSAITYGTALSTTQLNATAFATIAGTSTPVSGTFLYTPAAGAVLGAGSHTLSVAFTPTDTIDYITPSAATVTLVINKATPSLNWATPQAITYGTALSPTQLNATATWPIAGISTTVAGTFTYTPAAGTMLSAGAQPLLVSFVPTDTTNYNTPSSPATVTLTVNKTTPTITWATPAAITYGTPLGAAQLDASSGGVAGTFVYTPTSGSILGAGSQTLSVTFTPTDTTDYNATSPATTTLTINKASPTVTWATPALVVAGTTLGATQLNATASVPGTFVYTPAAGTVMNTAGNIPLSATFTPTDVTDYNTATDSVALTVSTVTISGSAITVAPGATTGNTSTITITPSYGFTGTVNLSCSISPTAPSDPASCSFPSASSVTISGTNAQTIALAVTTTAATAINDQRQLFWPPTGGALLACILLIGIPARRSCRSIVGMLVLLIACAGGILACGGGGGGGNSNPGTTAGTYTVTVTGTSGSLTTTGTVQVTVQ